MGLYREVKWLVGHNPKVQPFLFYFLRLQINLAQGVLFFVVWRNGNMAQVVQWNCKWPEKKNGSKQLVHNSTLGNQTYLLSTSTWIGRKHCKKQIIQRESECFGVQLYIIFREYEWSIIRNKVKGSFKDHIQSIMKKSMLK